MTYPPKSTAVRLSLWFSLVWTLLAAACAPQRPAAGPLRFAFPGAPAVKDVPLLMALDALAEQGQAIEVIEVARFDLMPETLARAEADVGSFSTQGGWAAIAEGADLRSVVSQFGMLWLAIASNEIGQCSDLDGRPVAFGGARGVQQALFETYVSQNCPEAAPDYITLPAGDSEARLAALLSGEIVATSLQYENLPVLEREAPGRFHLLVSYGRAHPEIQIGTLAVRREWAAQNGEVIRAVIRALLTVHRQIAADPALLQGEIVERLGYEPAEARVLAGLYLEDKVWDVNGSLTLENAQLTIAVLEGVGALPAGMRANDVVDLLYLDAVLVEMGRQ